MILETLFSTPAIFLAWVVAIVIALAVHEFSHALAGNLLGDPTAKNLGRLTLNPLAHISWLGFVVLLLVGFGWGKPVPFNPYNLKFKRWGPALVAVAGPLSNLIMAVATGFILWLLIFFQALPSENLLIQFLYIFVILNVILMVFNLIPIPPLDGSKILYAVLHQPKYRQLIIFLETRGPMLLILLLILDNIIGINIFGNLFWGIIDLVDRIIF